LFDSGYKYTVVYMLLKFLFYHKKFQFWLFLFETVFRTEIAPELLN